MGGGMVREPEWKDRWMEVPGSRERYFIMNHTEDAQMSHFSGY